jgi:metal-responsive CopG/Arc/MetJ family transcriptional regulator
LSTEKIIAMLQNRMPRRKLFEARINLPLTADLLARLDAALRSDEYRVDFVRDAIKRELERREAEQKRRRPKVRKS